MNKKIKVKDCLFAHPWIDDEKDPWLQEGLISSIEFSHQLINKRIRLILTFFIIIFTSLYFYYVIKKYSMQYYEKKIVTLTSTENLIDSTSSRNVILSPLSPPLNNSKQGKKLTERKYERILANSKEDVKEDTKFEDN
jgi:hypothetical protein